jgi:hypothetical protein
LGVGGGGEEGGQEEAGAEEEARKGRSRDHKVMEIIISCQISAIEKSISRLFF